jgi:RNA polymerase sigma-70 factor (ECF subfamily)
MSAPIETYSDNLHEDGSPVGDPLGGPQDSAHADLLEEARQEAALHSGNPGGNATSSNATSSNATSGKSASGNVGTHQTRERSSKNASTGYVHRKPVDHAEDEQLFRSYQAGDERAFLKLYDKYKSSIYAYCARTLLSAGLDQTHVDDAFQEVFLRVTQYQHTFTGGEFRAWVFTVTRHTCLSTKKKGLKHRITNEYVGDAENLDEGTSLEIRNALRLNEDDPLEALSKREQTELLLKAIEQLPETYREALILSDYEGMTYDEIGKMTGTSLSTIRIRIFRAKARLRKMLLPIIGDEADKLIGLPPDDEE